MSIQEIAKLAGVSVATVSRVINGHDSVKPDLVRRVREVMRETGYTPRVRRPGPKPRKVERSAGPKAVGVVLAGRTEELLDAPYMSRFMAGVADSCSAGGSRMLVLPMPDRHELPAAVREQAVDGLILLGLGGSPAPEFQNMFHPLPSVWMGGAADAEIMHDHVLADNRRAGRVAADYLIQRGCRSFAFVNHDPAHSGFDERFDAFSSVLRKHGFSADQPSCGCIDSGEQDIWSQAVMRREMSCVLDKLTAAGSMAEGVFLPTDLQAAVFFMLLRERGIKPEEDVVLISCNNDAQARGWMDPSPATIDLRPYDQGRECYRCIVTRLQDPSIGPRTIMVSPALVNQ